MPITFWFTGGVLITVLGMVLALLRYVGAKQALIMGAVATVWLTITAVVAANGLLSDFSSRPPRILMVILPVLVGSFIIAFHPATRDFLRRVPPVLLVGAQAFRIIVELLLDALFKAGLIHATMTWHGRNFDILTGLTAPIIALLIIRLAPRFSKSLAVIWNLAGLALLLNVAVPAILSTPSPFQVFHPNPPFILITQAPFVWLAAFFVPLALVLHLLSLRQLLGKSKPATE